MLYGRRLDEALEHVDGSRYALVHAVAKRARQITLWLTADPAELRSEEAPPPAPGELVSRDPVALSEAEILQGEVRVRWDPDGTADEREIPEPGLLDTDALLVEGVLDEEGDFLEAEEEAEGAPVTPALAQALEGEAAADADEEAEDEGPEVATDPAVLAADTGDIDEEGEVDVLLDDEGDDLVDMDIDEADELDETPDVLL